MEKVFLVLIVFLISIYFFNITENKTSIREHPITIQELKPLCELVFAQSQIHGVFDYNGYKGDYGFLYDKKILCSSILTAKRGYIWDSMDISIDTISRKVYINKANPTWISKVSKCEFLYGKEGVFSSLTTVDYNRADSISTALLITKIDTVALDNICREGLSNFLYQKIQGKKYSVLIR